MLRLSFWRKLFYNFFIVFRGVVSYSIDYFVIVYLFIIVFFVCRGLLGILYVVFWMFIMFYFFIYFVMICLNNFEFNFFRFFFVFIVYFFFFSFRIFFVMCFVIYIYIRNKLLNNFDGCINYLWKDYL